MLRENAISFLLILYIISLIFPAIRPGENSFSMHSVSLPLSNEAPTISPSIGSISFYIIVSKLALICRALIKFEKF